MVYLDHNATTKPSDRVIEAVNKAMREDWANPSSVHRFGQQAKHSVEVARGQVAKLLGVAGGGRGVVFTGTGTEAIGLALRGTMGALKSTGRRVVVTSTVEHSAVLELCDAMESAGEIEVRKVGVDQNGMILFDELEAALGGDLEGGQYGGVGMVSIQWVNNETGVIQDVARIGELCKSRGVVFHCDATQWVGKMQTRVEGDDPELGSGIGVLTCAPHKFHGIKGVGVLWARRGVRMVPVIPGSQELGRRGGTEGVPAIVGAGVAAEEAMEWLGLGEAERRRVERLRDRLEGAIVSRCSEELGIEVVVNSAGGPRIWSATNIGFGGLEAEALLLAMSERGLCASAGAACSSGSLDPSPVLIAMGVASRMAHGSVRLSVSRETTEAEIDEAVEIVLRSVEVVGRSMV